MTNETFVARLQGTLLPRHYPNDLSAQVPPGYLLFRKGAYICLVMPFRDATPGDYGSKQAKTLIRSAMTCLPLVAEKGLFLIYYGEVARWGEVAPRFTVDKTALRPVILQSVHFIDPATGANVNSRTHWGPLRFGFCGPLIADIEALAGWIGQGGGQPDATPHVPS